jgi:hypothetical protein
VDIARKRLDEGWSYDSGQHNAHKAVIIIFIRYIKSILYLGLEGENCRRGKITFPIHETVKGKGA